MASPDQVSELSAGQALDAMARLEQALIKIYLESKGHTLESLNDLVPSQARKLHVEASVYASCRMAEVEARARVLGSLARSD